jgi:hypothetical protein
MAVCDRLAVVADKGNQKLFETVLAECHAAKADCEDIRAERERHEAEHPSTKGSVLE